jgi:hypothetical protein
LRTIETATQRNKIVPKSSLGRSWTYILHSTTCTGIIERQPVLTKEVSDINAKHDTAQPNSVTDTPLRIPFGNKDVALKLRVHDAKVWQQTRKQGNQQFPHDTLLVPCSLSVSIGTIGDVTNVTEWTSGVATTGGKPRKSAPSSF